MGKIKKKRARRTVWQEDLEKVIKEQEEMGYFLRTVRTVKVAPRREGEPAQYQYRALFVKYAEEDLVKEREPVGAK